MSVEEYKEILNKEFIQNTDNELLLEREWNISDMRESILLVRNYCTEHREIFDDTVFGKFLFKKLKAVFEQENPDIRYFGGVMYRLWETLPPWLQDREAFYSLSYADDPLSWGDEEQTRKLYEEAFKFYDKNHTL